MERYEPPPLPPPLPPPSPPQPPSPAEPALPPRFRAARARLLARVAELADWEPADPRVAALARDWWEHATELAEAREAAGFPEPWFTDPGGDPSPGGGVGTIPRTTPAPAPDGDRGTAGVGARNGDRKREQGTAPHREPPGDPAAAAPATTAPAAEGSATTDPVSGAPATADPAAGGSEAADPASLGEEIWQDRPPTPPPTPSRWSPRSPHTHTPPPPTPVTLPPGPDSPARRTCESLLRTLSAPAARR
ncbi:hypothetical protein ACN20G_07350 [Streptomyces sp. BI20]|uniref:hypothetical protein n=1 Tax=Streptomyces sp. BI20 TaxID=3403460 RepID=UPI003C779194